MVCPHRYLLGASIEGVGMAKKKVAHVDEVQIEWIKQHLGCKSFAHMARHLGCCTDTLMRKLNKLGLHQSKGAKYLLPTDYFVPMWQRPYMNCRCDKPSQRNLYLCEKCRYHSVLYA